MRVTLLFVLLATLLALLTVDSVNGKTDYSKYNARTGKKFLDENTSKPGVTTLPSGLQYKIITSGSGSVHPLPESQVKVHYRGTLLNGKEFDSSYKRGEPATFGVGQVIPGWTEILQLMVEGDVWEVYIPSNLGYGERGAGADIGPNSTLIFKVELQEIIGGKGKKASKETKSSEETPTEDL